MAVSEESTSAAGIGLTRCGDVASTAAGGGVGVAVARAVCAAGTGVGTGDARVAEAPGSGDGGRASTTDGDDGLASATGGNDGTAVRCDEGDGTATATDGDDTNAAGCDDNGGVDGSATSISGRLACVLRRDGILDGGNMAAAPRLGVSMSAMTDKSSSGVMDRCEPGAAGSSDDALEATRLDTGEERTFTTTEEELGKELVMSMTVLGSELVSSMTSSLVGACVAGSTSSAEAC